MTTGKPGLPVSERTLRAFGHYRPSKKGASLNKEGANFGRAHLVRLTMSSVSFSFSSLLSLIHYELYCAIQRNSSVPPYLLSK